MCWSIMRLTGHLLAAASAEVVCVCAPAAQAGNADTDNATEETA